MRDGALTSKVGVEILWLSFLWIMWIATGGETATIVGAIGFYGCLDSRVYFLASFRDTVILTIRYSVRSESGNCRVCLFQLAIP